jgi:hypothetical protein
VAKITITLTDTADGLDITSDFAPTRGAPCSAAQAAALDIIARTRKNFGLHSPAPLTAPDATRSAE